MDHVSRRGRETAENFGVVQGLLGVTAGLDCMNPVVIGCRVVRILFQDRLQNRQGLLLTRSWFTILLVSVLKGVCQK